MSSQTKKIIVGVIAAFVLYHFYMQSQVKHAQKGQGWSHAGNRLTPDPCSSTVRRVRLLPKENGV